MKTKKKPYAKQDPALRGWPTEVLSDIYEALHYADHGFESRRIQIEEAYVRHKAFDREHGMKTCQYELDRIDLHEKTISKLRERVRKAWAERQGD